MRPEDELEWMHGSGVGGREDRVRSYVTACGVRRIVHRLYRFRPQSKQASSELHKRGSPSDIWPSAPKSNR